VLKSGFSGSRARFAEAADIAAWVNCGDKSGRIVLTDPSGGLW
jgi:hypothetical protein